MMKFNQEERECQRSDDPHELEPECHRCPYKQDCEQSTPHRVKQWSNEA